MLSPSNSDALTSKSLSRVGLSTIQLPMLALDLKQDHI